MLDVQSGLLRAPFERHLDVPRGYFCSKTGRLPGRAASLSNPDSRFVEAAGVHVIVYQRRGTANFLKNSHISSLALNRSVPRCKGIFPSPPGHAC